MRSWYLSRIALERRFEPPPDQQWGVYDRRPSTTMFVARVISGCLAFCAFVFGLSATNIHQSSSGGYKSTGSTYDSVPPSSQSLYYSYSNGYNGSTATPVALNGTRVLASDGTEIVFQVPAGSLLGTVLMLHGCSHSATDFFPSGQLCTACIGLPEETKMTRLALEKGYSVVAVSSTNRARKCWSTHPKAAEGPDYDRINTALQEAQEREAYSSRVPLFAVGASSGGLFATSLPWRFQVAGVNSIVSSSVCLHWGEEVDTSKTTYPAHVFTHMGTRDKGTARRVQQAMQKLRNIGTASIEFSVSPKPVTERYLLDAVPRWSPSLVSEVVSALKRGGHLDDDYRLISDPRHSYWRNSVKHLEEKLGDNLFADQSPLSEELNRAWGGHEITSEYFQSALDFLQDKLRG